MKNLIIVGSNGSLGKGVTDVLIKKDFEKIYLIDRKFDDANNSSNVIQLVVNDLSSENEVIKA